MFIISHLTKNIIKVLFHFRLYELVVLEIIYLPFKCSLKIVSICLCLISACTSNTSNKFMTFHYEMMTESSWKPFCLFAYLLLLDFWLCQHPL